MARPKTTAAPFLPEQRTLRTLREAAQACRGCDLHACATQAVFGEGAHDARIMFVGEQPGDLEDLAGRPFVGPAGRVLDDALAAAGIPRSAVYVTNAIKHFKFTRRGKRRIHAKPTRYELDACRPWLGAELELVRPEILVLLGATTAQSLLGTAFRVSQQRGQLVISAHARWTFATVHPSSVLRAPDDETRTLARQAFFSDVATVGAYYRQLGHAPSPIP